jgi:hypothetical protein
VKDPVSRLIRGWGLRVGELFKFKPPFWMDGLAPVKGPLGASGKPRTRGQEVHPTNYSICSFTLTGHSIPTSFHAYTLEVKHMLNIVSSHSAITSLWCLIWNLWNIDHSGTTNPGIDLVSTVGLLTSL